MPSSTHYEVNACSAGLSSQILRSSPVPAILLFRLFSFFLSLSHYPIYLLFSFSFLPFSSLPIICFLPSHYFPSPAFYFLSSSFPALHFPPRYLLFFIMFSFLASYLPIPPVLFYLFLLSWPSSPYPTYLFSSLLLPPILFFICPPPPTYNISSSPSYLLFNLPAPYHSLPHSPPYHLPVPSHSYLLFM